MYQNKEFLEEIEESGHIELVTVARRPGENSR